MGHSRMGHGPSFLGTQYVLSSRPRHTVITVCPSPSLIPGPPSCLGLQWTPSPCPHSPRPRSSLSSDMSVCTPLLSTLPSINQGRSTVPWFPRHSRMPHIIGTGVGQPRKEPGIRL
nr:hypothetical protein DKFZp434K0920.1 - human [Homo sapiens]